MTRMKVFIHTNDKQFLGAQVGKFRIVNTTRHREKFDIEFINLEDYPCLTNRQGQEYTRSGIRVAWDNSDLQSFTLLRFLAPELMGYQGRSVVIDPDVFAISDIYELLSMDMNGKAILCRRIPATEDRLAYYASSVMLLDNSKLTHWSWENDIA